MIDTPIANRKNIVIIGNRNSGKSSLFNYITGQDISIVSDYAGTTTDPVWKAMELIGYGPIKIVDTAGIDDVGELGELRAKKSFNELSEADLVVHVISVDEVLEYNQIEKNINVVDKSNDIDYIKKQIQDITKEFREKYTKMDKKHLFIINKCDKYNKKTLTNLNNEYDDVVFTSVSEDKINLELDKSYIIKKIISQLQEISKEKSLISGMLKSGEHALLVVPIDTEAPEGRLILPQVQMIRSCLDLGVRVSVVRDTELEQAISEMKNIDLVITDSKIFDKVAELVPSDVKLTSFSILFARQKGDIEEFLKGAKKIEELKDGDKILIAESCTHTKSHEDIGTVLIPNLIKKKTGKNLEFDFAYGKNIPSDLKQYSIIIQCGGCMMTRTNMMNRVNLSKSQEVAMTNYGVILAYLKGVFKRAVY
ncbi:[FeFe] hydrogenase H-cluster maturation GTPase HydF [Peptostreptococcus faecalis]|uniref:[FeFe] hydrogenase H-cluster maturation GTPase HydF n=1 Tax=Peptostreptococcus faecalis TaxID=2045015 RepID=UPI001FA92838|nr:[FeFe] hydrogenase H-cluster maturation GTPase HydF [Peptostreptococcus faecalis]